MLRHLPACVDALREEELVVREKTKQLSNACQKKKKKKEKEKNDCPQIVCKVIVECGKRD
jgi:hypothetical protein